MGKHNLKRIMFFVTESSISKQLGGGVKIIVENDATVLGVIVKAGDTIRKKGTFPNCNYKLLHMLYNPNKDAFYKQVGVHAYLNAS